MLLPDKLTDPHNCLLYYIYKIIKHCREYKVIKLKTLEEYMCRTINDFSYDLFVSAIDILYLLIKVEYNPNNDELEFNL